MTRMAAVLATAVWLVAGTASVTPGVHAQSSATLVSGHTWTNMSDAARVAYVAGMTNLVELERARPGAAGLTNSESFSRYLVRGLQGRALRQVVEGVNG